MRVLVCGGRDFNDGVLAFRTLDTFGASVIIEGGARGADAIARSWAEHRGIPVKTFRADWDGLGRSAGHIRNTDMLNIGKPDLVIAFSGGRGTADMVRKSREAGVPVVVL